MRLHRSPRLTATALMGAALITLAPLPSAQAKSLPAVGATAETKALYDDEAGGNANADDPAIWRNDADPGRSLVLATAKEGGLRVYGLDAALVQSVPAPPAASEDDAPGRFNNVDLVTGLRTLAGRTDVAVVSDRERPPPRLPHRPLAPRASTEGRHGLGRRPGLLQGTRPRSTTSGPRTGSPRGRTAGPDARTPSSAGCNTTDLALLELRPTAAGTVGYEKVSGNNLLLSSFRLPNGGSWTPCGEPGELPQVEGMVVDPATGTLYGFTRRTWASGASRPYLDGRPVLVDKVREYGVPGTYDLETEECTPGTDPGFGGKRLTADVEGLTLFRESDGDGYLMASSQGDDTFALYDREVSEGNEYEGGFRITAVTADLDGSEEDGAAVLNEPLGARYPNGLLVVQDGHETSAAGDGEGREATGFKFVDLGAVTDAAGM